MSQHRRGSMEEGVRKAIPEVVDMAFAAPRMHPQYLMGILAGVRLVARMMDWPEVIEDMQARAQKLRGA